jgi:hypothetical protein
MAEVKAMKLAKKIFIISIILLVGILLYKIVSSEPAIKPLANNIISLKFTENPLEKAKIVSSTDNLIKRIENKEISKQWEGITKCITESCPDKRYFDFLIVLFTQYKKEIPRSDLILNILAIERYWGTEEVITFSKAMTYTDEEIEKLQSRTIKKKWEEVLLCNNICQNKSDLFLDLIKNIIA